MKKKINPTHIRYDEIKIKKKKTGPKPKATSKVIRSISVDPRMWRILQLQSKKTKVSTSAIVGEIIRDYLTGA